MLARLNANAETIFFLLIGLVFLFFGVQTLRTGRTTGRGGATYYRDKNPVTFWTSVVAQFFFGILAVVLSIDSMR